MKRKNVPAALLLLLFCSCKKERVCECTSNYTYVFEEPNGTKSEQTSPATTYTHTYQAVRKNEVANQCGNASSQEAYNTKENGVSSTYTNTSQVTCILK